MIASLSGAPEALELSGGVWIIVAFVVFALGAVIFSYFTETGTDIRFHAWGDHRGDAPGSFGIGNVGKDRTVDVRNWTHGTSARRHRNLPPPAAAHASVGGDPELLSELAAWRRHLRSETSGLSAPPDPARDHTLGPPGAPLQLLGYFDFECPSCQAAAQVVDKLRKRLGDELLLVVRHFPIADAHPFAQTAAEATEAAGAQGRFWEMYRRIYAARRPPTRESLGGHAERMHLDLPRFEGDLRSHAYAPRVRDDFESGLQSGVNGTPTFFVNGVRYDDEHTFDPLLAALERARPQHAEAIGT
jgi:predicted DsbA family dithiol-disulfide isomerase